MTPGPAFVSLFLLTPREADYPVATPLISLGSNLGDRAATLRSALAAIGATRDVSVVRASKFYETSPVGGPGLQEPFLNAAAMLETTLEPEALLDVLQRVESEHGRVREERWGPRTLDLDLLTYDDLALHTSRLTLPHPRLSYRKFVLDGLLEIAPHERHPLIGRSYCDLLKHLETTHNYVAFVGPSTAGGADFRSQFAAEAADCGSAKLVEATPSDVPAFTELAASPSLDVGTTIKFMKARAAAIRTSLNEADDKWIVDDGWLPAELMTIAHRHSFKDFHSHVDEFRAAAVELGKEVRADDVMLPKLLAVLRNKNETPQAAIASLKQWPLGVDMPPIVDLDYSDRERALTEFAAALDAAR